MSFKFDMCPLLKHNLQLLAPNLQLSFLLSYILLVVFSICLFIYFYEVLTPV